MKIVEARFLRGPNLFARRTVLEAIVDLETLDEVASNQIDGFTDRLIQMLPGIGEHHCGVGYRGGFVDRLREGTYMGHIAEHIMLELQALGGYDIGYGKTRMVHGRPRHYRIVVGYKLEKLAMRALEQALQVVQAAADGRVLDIAPLVEELRAIRCKQGLGPSTQAIVDAAHDRGIPAIRLSDDASLFQLGWGSRQRLVQATVTGASGHIAVGIASDKELTKRLLSAAGIPVPRGFIVTSIEEAQVAARDVGMPVTLKPLDANQGKGVTTGIRTPQEVAVAFERARQHGPKVIVEQHVRGQDHRVLVVNGRVVAASRRLPPQVVSDGRRTVRELVEEVNADPRRGVGHESALTRIPLDASAADCLAAQGLGFESVLPTGAVALLRGNANLSTGGTAEDVTDQLHPDTAALCVRAARRIGLDVAGIDLVCADIAAPLGPQGGALIEVNAAPGIRMHEQPSEGVPRAAGRAIVDGLFPPGDDGRIPLIAVTGTNGKTTTTLAIAHVLRAAGLRTGCTTTEGVYVNGERIMDGDCTGYWSGRAVLTDPDVDAAVLETARGGILKRGLCYDRSDVAVVLNVTADHLGQDGVDTLEELARVKAVVADTARKALVLNAEDPHCVAMTEELREGVEVIFFAMQAEHPVVQGHLQAGGRAVLLRDGEIVLATRDGSVPVVRADRLPFTLGGRARHNVANALAAVAALVGSGQALGTIAQALQGFACSSEANPLRLNVFQLGEVRLVVDYAHNLAAYRALIDTCRGFGSGRLVGVVSAPGDRRDRELQDIGEACAQGFDEIVIYEIDEDRGRPLGATARALLQGAQRTGRPASVEVDMCRALRQALQRCRPGDTLVYACATRLSDLQAAFGHLPMAEERASGGPALRLAWSSELPRSPVGEAERLQERDVAATGRRVLLPRRHEPA
ncbi:cyanophycin synthetase [Ideonella sp. BN130291]|uniref:cyanophycin synthetase n=1 Tax=Ideonella sp. BN130291 TaxID=3112940 RepID=UPI002E276225|nr:cyanophycin synthetase [Ideonella sp. BN130291]